MKKIRLWSILLLIPFFSCQSFLDEQPENLLPVDDAIVSIEDCESYLVGVYSMFKNTGALAYNGMILPDVQCDMVNYVLGNGGQLGEVHNWTFGSQSEYVSSVWNAYYAIIFRANFLLQGADKLGAQWTKELSSAEEEKKADLQENIDKLNDIKAQCYLARALARVELVKFYAPAYDPETASSQLALPIVNKLELISPSRVTMDKYYQAVLDDLTKAQKIKNRKVDDIYFTSAAAYALTARVNLYMHRWKDAIDAATEVIKDSRYELLKAYSDGNVANAWSSEYAEMWRFDRGNEIIWKIGYTSEDQSLGSLAQNFSRYDGSGKFYPEFMPSPTLLKIYGDMDGRRHIFFEERTTNYTHNGFIEALRKYPGNQELNYGASSNRYVNMPKVFRLSELYLIRAEAYYHLEQTSLANNDLRDLREARIANYYHISTSGEELYKEIQQERVCELCFEGHRLYDLKRYGKGFKRESQENSQPATSSLEIESTNLRFVWPIPKSELEVPNSNMVGNPSNAL